MDSAKFAEGMYPDPPDLKEVANETSPQELFWVIKNGIKHDGDAELRRHRGTRPGNLEHRSLRQEAAERDGRGLQGLDRACSSRTGVRALKLQPTF